MPIKIQDSLPAQKILENENIFVMTEYRAMHQDIRPLHVLILNLMPTKIETETQLLRKLSNTPLQVDVEFMQTSSYKPTHVAPSHLETFYRVFDDIKDRNFDGMIITGAPLDYTKFEDVDYWDELTNIMEWSKKHVHCTLYMCWAAFAGLYYHYGIERVDREEKLSGVYKHRVLKKSSPLFRGFDDIFDCPQSRAMTVNREDVEKIPELEVLAVSDAAGVGQMVYVALATMLFMVFTLFSTVVLTMQNAFTGNRWSRTAAALAYSGSGKELNLPSAVKAIEMSRPWQSMFWVLALMLLYTLVMVLVMLLFNIWKGQIAGIAAVISFSCYGLLLNPDNIKKVLHLPDQLSYKARVLVGWISPLNQATFYMHNFGYDKLPTLGQTVAIGLALLAVLLILTICAIRRYAFSFSGTEGK